MCQRQSVGSLDLHLTGLFVTPCLSSLSVHWHAQLSGKGMNVFSMLTCTDVVRAERIRTMPTAAPAPALDAPCHLVVWNKGLPKRPAPALARLRRILTPLSPPHTQTTTEATAGTSGRFRRQGRGPTTTGPGTTARSWTSGKWCSSTRRRPD